MATSNKGNTNTHNVVLLAHLAHVGSLGTGEDGYEDGEMKGNRETTHQCNARGEVDDRGF